MSKVSKGNRRYLFLSFLAFFMTQLLQARDVIPKEADILRVDANGMREFYVELPEYGHKLFVRHRPGVEGALTA